MGGQSLVFDHVETRWGSIGKTGALPYEVGLAGGGRTAQIPVTFSHQSLCLEQETEVYPGMSGSTVSLSAL